jgi:anthranilate/para-aminobenzoate synthase component I
LPSGSVTGAPKVRAMEVIGSLEAARRGAYTGAWGTLAHDGSLNLGMNIRCLSRRGDEAEYWVGGGLVADSQPLREVEETRWKSVQVLAACEG